MRSGPSPNRGTTVPLAITALTIVAGLSTRPAYGYDNRDRYQGIRNGLRDTAPLQGIGQGYAGVKMGDSIDVRRMDTPSDFSFSSLTNAMLIFGKREGLLGHADWGGEALHAPCRLARLGGVFGAVEDLRYYMMGLVGDPSAEYKACATNTHTMYNELLKEVVNCGRQCFVDIASLHPDPTSDAKSGIDHVRQQLASGIKAWAALNRDRPGAKLVLRVIIGYGGLDQSSADAKFFLDAVQESTRLGPQVEVYVAALQSAVGGYLGNWSHAKAFAVHSRTTHVALLGGQNHYTDYDREQPPFDTNTRIYGEAAELPSLQLDAALRGWQASVGPERWLGKWVGRDDRGEVKVMVLPSVSETGRSVLYGPFFGASSINPLEPAVDTLRATEAVVSLVDMGGFSASAVGRTISQVLRHLIRNEPLDTEIRVWNQSLVMPPIGNSSARHGLTPMGSLVHRALRDAMENPRGPSKLRLLTSSSTIKNLGYPSVRAGGDRGGWWNLYTTGMYMACVNDRLHYFTRFKEGEPENWTRLRDLYPSRRGKTTCRQAVTAAISAKVSWVMTKAYINNGTTPQSPAPTQEPVGIHHKIVMFGKEAMFQGSYNIYSSRNPSLLEHRGPEYDSQLIENGAVFLKPSLVNEYASAFDVAFRNGVPVL